jgi:hypothetical protein
MTADANKRLARVEQITRWLAPPALLVCALLAFRAPQEAVQAYWFGLFAWFGVALGSLVIGLIHRTTGGQWGLPLAPYLSAGIRLLPWLWLFALPLLFTSLRGSALHAVADDRSLAVYLSRPLVIVRAVIFGLIFLLLRWGYLGRRALWLGPVGLIVTVFTAHLLTIDWVFCFEPKWRSTGFPLIWLSGQAVSGLAAAIAFTLFAGKRPASVGNAGRPLGIDWGNLMLTSTMIWTYVAFAQFLIIWAGNLPEETSWYVHRRSVGWMIVAACLILFHFLLPFFLLLSRRIKQNALGLGIVATLLLASQLLYSAWTFLPYFSRSDLLVTVLRLTTLLLIGSAFLNRYVWLARKYAVVE